MVSSARLREAQKTYKMSFGKPWVLSTAAWLVNCPSHASAPANRPVNVAAYITRRLPIRQPKRRKEQKHPARLSTPQKNATSAPISLPSLPKTTPAQLTCTAPLTSRTHSSPNVIQRGRFPTGTRLGIALAQNSSPPSRSNSRGWVHRPRPAKWTMRNASARTEPEGGERT